MPGWIWAIIAVVAIVAVVVVASRMLARRRTQRLQRRFGPEYDRATRVAASKKDAEAELTEREERREKLAIRPLSAEARRRYAAKWQEVQANFVDSPPEAVTQADGLVHGVMSDQGYPMEDFDRRAADVSVDHPQVVENYRAAHRIFEAIESGDVSTEQERQAMQHYRRLFDELLEASEVGSSDEATSSTPQSERAATRG